MLLDLGQILEHIILKMVYIHLNNTPKFSEERISVPIPLGLEYITTNKCMIIKQNKLSVFHVILYSMLLSDGLLLVKDIFYQCLYNRLYGSTITLPMLISVYQHRNYGWATSKCTEIFSIPTPGATPIIFFLQS